MNDTKPQVTLEGRPDARHLAAAEQAMKSLTKLVNGRRIYAESHPRLDQFRQEFDGALRAYFQLEDEFVLQIEQYTIRWSEEIVYENPKREESIAFLLFKDGIGEITIQPRAVGAETERLAGIFADELHAPPGGDDVVTRLWNADFEFISYRVLDDYLAGQFGPGELERDEHDRHDETSDHPELLPSLSERGRVVVQRSDALESIDTMLRAVLRRHAPAIDDREREAAYQRFLRSMFTIPAEELAIYRRELDAERAEDGLAEFADAMLVFTLLPDNPSAVRDVMSVLDRVVAFAVQERTPDTLARLLGSFRALRARDDLTDPVIKYADKSLARLSDTTMLASFFEGLSGTPAHVDAVVAYAKAVGAPAIDVLAKALHRVEGQALHRKLCDALIAVAGDTLAEVVDRLDVDHPEVAVDAVYLARALQAPVLTPRLRELVFYPDARVKLDMLAWIAGREDAEATGLLISSLADLDKRVRMRVLEALAARPVPPVRERLTELALAKDLAERANDEQEAIFRALGRVGNRQTVETLRGVVDRRRLIAIGKGGDMKVLAIRALEQIHDPAALDLLTRLAADASEAIRLRALRAKETLTAAMADAPAAGGERRP